MVSEQTLNLALAAGFESGQLVLRQNETSAFLNELFPNFETVFGKHEAVPTELRAVQAPVLTVDSVGSTLSAQIALTVWNPLGVEQGYEALVLEGTLNAEALLLLRIESHTLTLCLKSPRLELASLRTLYYSKQTADSLNSLDTQPWAESLAASINELLFNHDLGLPLAKPVLD